jgi:hypothetical protein
VTVTEVPLVGRPDRHSVRLQFAGAPSIRCVSISVVSDAVGGFPARVQVRSPLAEAELAGLPDGPVVVQFCSALTDADHRALGSWFAGHPEAALRMYDSVGITIPEPDLEFLRYYSGLNGLVLNLYHPDSALTSMDGLRHLPDGLRELALDLPRPKGFDLATLARFTALDQLLLSNCRRLPAVLGELPGLRRLAIVGPVADLEPVGSAADLEELRLGSVTADLAPLRRLHSLTDLTISLGSITDVSVLPTLPSLRRVELTWIRRLSDLSPLGRCARLDTLYLEALRQVTALPDLSGARRLRSFFATTMNGLTNLNGLATAPALDRVGLRCKGPDDLTELAPLRGMTPSWFDLDLDTRRRTFAARDLIQIPGTYWGQAWTPDIPPHHKCRYRAQSCGSPR